MENSEANRQGVRDAASVLPFIVTVLLLPPVILIFAAPGMVSGVPLILLYIFAVWTAAIIAAAFIAWRLDDERPAISTRIPDENGES